MHVARTRNGFVPAPRRQMFSKWKHLLTPGVPIHKFAGDEAITIWRRTQRRGDDESSLVEDRSLRAD